MWVSGWTNKAGFSCIRNQTYISLTSSWIQRYITSNVRKVNIRILSVQDPMSWGSLYHSNYERCVRLFSKFGDASLISLGLLISIAYIRLWKSCHTRSALILGTDTLKMRCDDERQTEGKVRDFMVSTTSLKCSYFPRLQLSKCPNYVISTAS